MTQIDIKIPDDCLASFLKQNNVVKYPADVLRTVALEVNSPNDVKSLITTMSDVLRNTSGVGLSAPQVGVSKRVIMVRREQRYALINPVIEEYSGIYLADEGCLSIPGLWGQVLRHKDITLRGTSPHGKEVILKLTEMEAVVPQHEIDHLDGVLFMDKAIQDSLYWYSASSELRLPVEFLKAS